MTKQTTRDKLLDAGKDLMLSRGYSATTVDDICDAAGVSKGSFYHFFETKEDLALEVLEQFVRGNDAILTNGAFVKEKDPARRLFAFLDHVESQSRRLWEKGCLLGNFSTDLASTSPAVRARVSALFSSIAGKLAPMFEPAARRTPGGPTAARLAEQWIAQIEGSIVLARAHGDAARIPQGVKDFRHYLRLLVES
jgi:TetR/AcrR family transcriptional repressor of nem operon